MSAVARKSPNPEHEPLIVILLIALVGVISLSYMRYAHEHRSIASDYFNPRSEARQVPQPWQQGG